MDSLTLEAVRDVARKLNDVVMSIKIHPNSLSGLTDGMSEGPMGHRAFGVPVHTSIKVPESDVWCEYKNRVDVYDIKSGKLKRTIELPVGFGFWPGR